MRPERRADVLSIRSRPPISSLPTEAPRSESLRPELARNSRSGKLPAKRGTLRPNRENRLTLCFSGSIARNGSRKAVQICEDYYPFIRDFASQSAKRSGPPLSRKASQYKALPAAPQRPGRPFRHFFQNTERSVQLRETGQGPVFQAHLPESDIERPCKNEGWISGSIPLRRSAPPSPALRSGSSPAEAG